MTFKPAVQAGIPVKEEEFEKKKIEGIPFFVRKDMLERNFTINWVGFWIFGQFQVNAD